MTQENTVNAIATALAKAQSEMGKALKQSNNPHFRSKYADLGSVMDACMPALNANGIAVIQPTITVEGERFVETIFMHGESGGQLSCQVPLIVSKNDMQAFGSAVTYARRYGLMTMAGIAPEDDDGNAAKAAPPEPRQAAPKPLPKEAIDHAVDAMANAETLGQLRDVFTGLPKPVQAHPDVIAAKDKAKLALEADAAHDAAVKAAPITDDEIPY